MKFFKSDDFRLGSLANEVAANTANEKLGCESRVVWGSTFRGEFHTNRSTLDTDAWKTQKALLICIEPIEKCKHIKATAGIDFSVPHKTIIEYVCECGARVKPSSFEEI